MLAGAETLPRAFEGSEIEGLASNSLLFTHAGCVMIKAPQVGVVRFPRKAVSTRSRARSFPMMTPLILPKLLFSPLPVLVLFAKPFGMDWG